MSLILGIDTATADTCVAAGRIEAGGDGLEEVSAVTLEPPPGGGRPRHARELLRAVEEVIEAAGSWSQIQRIAVGVGPGSFTGVRIGVATARALAQGHGLPVAAVRSTEALAAGLPRAGGTRLGVIDARRGEVFVSVIRSGQRAAEGALVCPPEALAEAVQGLAGALAAGDGAIRFRSELEAAGAEVPADGDPVHRLSASQVCRLGAEAPAGPPEDVRPLYLRRPDAERWRERDRGN